MEPTTQESKPTPPEKQEPKPVDFKHLFLVSAGNFLVEETPNYRLEADHARKLISLTLFKSWQTFSLVPTLDQHLRNIVASLVGEFAFLTDLSALTPNGEGVLLAPAIPSRGFFFAAGLVKVADVIPYNCEEVVHGPHSFTVNAVKMRQFTSRLHAESWLTIE